MIRQLLAVSIALWALSGCADRIPLMMAPRTPAASPVTLPIRVGFLPPRDVRPAAERRGAHPQPSFLFSGGGASVVIGTGALVQGDKLLGLQGSRNQFPVYDVSHLLGSYALETAQRTRVFAQIVPLPVEGWHERDLPAIARRYGVQYLMTMQLRHFYVMDFRKVIATSSHHTEGTVDVYEHETVRRTYGVAEAATFRFSFLRVDGPGVRTLWQRSTNATVLHPAKEPGPFSGSAALTRCMDELGAALPQIARIRG